MSFRPSTLLRPLRPLFSFVIPRTAPKRRSSSLAHARLVTIPSSIQLIPTVHQFSNPAAAAVVSPFQSSLPSSDITSNLVPPSQEQQQQQQLEHITSCQLNFTGQSCQKRATDEANVNRKAYHRENALIQCPSCKGRHKASDQLKRHIKQTFGGEEEDKEAQIPSDEILAEEEGGNNLRMDKDEDVEVLTPPEKDGREKN